MQILKIYRNYGCLSAEKRSIYTCDSPEGTAACWDQIEVAIPRELEVYENTWGTFVAFPWGEIYNVNECLYGNEKPCVIGYDDKMQKHIFYLNEV